MAGRIRRGGGIVCGDHCFDDEWLSEKEGTIYVLFDIIIIIIHACLCLCLCPSQYYVVCCKFVCVSVSVFRAMIVIVLVIGSGFFI